MRWANVLHFLKNNVLLAKQQESLTSFQLCRNDGSKKSRLVNRGVYGTDNNDHFRNACCEFLRSHLAIVSSTVFSITHLIAIGIQ